MNFSRKFPTPVKMAGAPLTTIETVTITRPLKVITKLNISCCIRNLLSNQIKHLNYYNLKTVYGEFVLKDSNL